MNRKSEIPACGRQANIEIPAFAEAPALRKASGGGISRRQAKQIFKILNFLLI
jgi:hypothetical protein